MKPNTEEKNSPETSDRVSAKQVELARQWLRLYATKSAEPHERSTYWFKHRVEDWRAMLGTNEYISTESFNHAALEEGYTLKLTGDGVPNARIHAEIRDEWRWELWFEQNPEYANKPDDGELCEVMEKLLRLAKPTKGRTECPELAAHKLQVELGHLYRALRDQSAFGLLWDADADRRMRGSISPRIKARVALERSNTAFGPQI